MCNNNFNICREDDCSNSLCTLASAKNPQQTSLVIPSTIPSAIPALLTQWSDIVINAQYACNNTTGFNNATGVYTAPQDGDYVVSLVVNYNISGPVTSPTIQNVPTIEIYDVQSSTKILGSQLSAISFAAEGPPVVSIVDRSIVTINAVIHLNCGQSIGIRALLNGLVYNSSPPAVINFSSNTNGTDTTFTIYKIRNTPILNVWCNN